MMSFAGCRGLWNMGFMGGHGLFGMGLMGGGFWLTGIAFLLIVFAAVYLFNRNGHPKTTSALEILDQEYAKGNISDDDYQKRKLNLKK